jgi:hypothetical protein
MIFDAPVIAPARGLDPAWLDYNGHLNMAYYNVLFDKAVDHVFELLGCGPGYLAERNLSFFTAEAMSATSANSSPTPGSACKPGSWILTPSGSICSRS